MESVAIFSPYFYTPIRTFSGDLKMKKILSFFSVILAAALIVCCLPLTSFAASKTDYLVLGDSIAYGQGIVNSNAGCYGKIVADTNGYSYKNYAVDGLTSKALLIYLDTPSVKSAIQEAEIIQISIGGNDFLTSNLPLLLITGLMNMDFMFNSIQKSFSKNFSDIVGKIKELNPGAKLLIQTLYNPCNNSLRRVYQKGVNCINNTIKTYLANNPGSFTIVDVESVFTGHADYIAVDTIHPNSKGNLAIAKKTLSVLGSGRAPVITSPASDWTNASQTNAAYSVINKLADFVASIFD